MQYLLKKPLLKKHVLHVLKELTIVFFTVLLVLTAPVFAYEPGMDIDNHNRSSELPAPERQKELINLVQQDCSACHGMTLKGGLGPSLLPERIALLSDQYLIDSIGNGHPGTPMPPWKPFLKANEIKWIVKQLQSGQLAHKINSN